MRYVCLYAMMYLVLTPLAWGGGWVLETVTTKDNGEGCSLAVDADGNPHVIYINREQRKDQLIYAYRENGTWQFQIVGSDLILETPTAVTLDPDGYAHCAYFDGDSRNLYCSYEDLQGWHTEVVDTSTSNLVKGASLSFAQWPNGQNRLTYDYVQYQWVRLYYAVYENGVWTPETVIWSSSMPGAFNVLICDAQQVPHVFFVQTGDAGKEIQHGEKDGDEWTFEKVGDGSDCDAYRTTDGKFHVAYVANDNSALYYAVYDGQSWETEAVDEANGLPGVPEICVAPNGDVYITYYDFDKLNLHIMKKAGTAWTHRVLASGSFSGYTHSMDIGTADYPQVVFYNAVSKKLRYAYYDDGSGIDLASFAARRGREGVDVRWSVADGTRIAGYNLYRDAADGGRLAVNSALITGPSPLHYRDSAARAEEGYDYWLEVVLVSGGTEEFGPAPVPPGAHAEAVTLYQNSPNPVVDATTFSFELAEGADVNLVIYDAAGRRVAAAAEGYFGPGRHDVPFRNTLAPGVYVYRLQAGANAAARKMVVVD